MSARALCEARGPSRLAEGGAGPGEVEEPFVDGDLLTAWFWNGGLICGEFEPRPPSPTFRRSMPRPMVLEADADRRLVELLRQVGQLIHAAIPEDDQATALFALTGMVDVGGRLWNLELCASPFVHPAVYGPLLKGLLSQRAS